MSKTHSRYIFYFFESVKIQLSDEAAKLFVPEVKGKDLILEFFFIEYVNFAFLLIKTNDLMEITTLNPLNITFKIERRRHMKLLALF